MKIDHYQLFNLLPVNQIQASQTKETNRVGDLVTAGFDLEKTKQKKQKNPLTYRLLPNLECSYFFCYLWS